MKITVFSSILSRSADVLFQFRSVHYFLFLFQAVN